MRPVFSVTIELGGGRVERDCDIFPGRVAGAFDRFHEQLERFVDRLERRRITAFVADERRQFAIVQHLAERVKRLGAGAYRFAQALHADRHDHALLKLQRTRGMLAAVDNVHHRHGQRCCERAAEIRIKWKADARRSRARDGE